MKNIIKFAEITECDFVYSECSEEDVDYLIQSAESVYIYSQIAENVKLRNDQFNLLFKDPIIKFYLAKNPYLTEDQFMMLYDGYYDDHSRGLAQNPNLTEKQINLLLNIKGTNEQIFALKGCLVSNKNINPIIRQKIIDDTIKKEVFK